MQIKIDKHVEMVLQFIGQVVPANKRLFVVESLGQLGYPLWGDRDDQDDDDHSEFHIVYDADVDGDDPVVKAQQRKYKEPSEEEAAAITKLRAGASDLSLRELGEEAARHYDEEAEGEGGC